MTGPKNVTVLVGSPSEPLHLISSELNEVSPEVALANAIGAPIRLSLVCWTMPIEPVTGFEQVVSLSSLEPSLFDRILTRLGARSVKQVLTRFPAGRLVNSLGPVDQSRIFYRAVNRSSEALAVLHSSDVLIAADLPAVKTAWALLHQKRVPRALYGLPAAIKELSR